MTYKAIEECPAHVIALGLNITRDILPCNHSELMIMSEETIKRFRAKEVLPKRDKIYAVGYYGEVSLLSISFSL